MRVCHDQSHKVCDEVDKKISILENCPIMQSPKKRPAPLQAGPKPKKIRLDADKLGEKLRRSRPITQPSMTEVNEDESEEQIDTCEEGGEYTNENDAQGPTEEDMVDVDENLIAKNPTGRFSYFL